MIKYYRNRQKKIKIFNKFQRSVAVIKKSGLFDRRWYIDQNPDVLKENIEPELHYVLHGALEGRDPSPLFQAEFYTGAHSDIMYKQVNPLLHYIEYGATEGRNPNPLFDTHWYVERFMSATASGMNPLAHFLAHDHPPSQRFDPQWYIEHYDLKCMSAPEALVHYFAFGQYRRHARNENEFQHFLTEISRIEDSKIFDSNYYIEMYPEVAAAGIPPVEHYYFYGAHEGRSINPVFSVDWYAKHYPGIDFQAVNPVLHYLDTGARNGASPSIWFDATWYVTQFPESASSALTPLEHFLVHGGYETSPSPRFDGPAYFRDCPEIARAGINPLVHYLRHGIREGRRAQRFSGTQTDAAEVSRARLACVKVCQTLPKEVALMVSHAPSGKIKGHVEHYIQSFVDNGIAVVLIVAADQRRTVVPKSIINLCDSVYIRENSGYDFAAWAHVIAENSTLLKSDIVFLTNDSLIGPLNRRNFEDILTAIRSSKSDIVGLTDNYHYAWHVQSFFLALKKKCLSSYEFNLYFQDISVLQDKDAVILEYEITFSMRMASAGLSIQTIFPMRKTNGFDVPGPGLTDKEHNRTILEWEWMLRGGFPFVKGSLVNGEHQNLFGTAPRLALTERGFDPSRHDAAFVYPGEKIWCDLDGDAPIRPTPCVSFIAPTPYRNGLGVAARSYLRALYRTTFSLNVHPIEKPFHVHSRAAPSWQVRSFSGDADIVLIHLNGESWNNLLSDRQKDIVARAKIRVGLFVWETSVVPPDWLRNVNRLDAIWVPSEFCAAIFRDATNIPVHVVPYVVENEPARLLDDRMSAMLRRTYRLDRKRHIILYAFDGSSFLARKNPQALIRAFRASGLYASGWQLVLKTKHVFDLPEEGARLFELVGTGGDVKVIDQPMMDKDFQTLFGLSEIYASSHASEGFGFTIAEAMEMGKVVVATDYGGSRDFLDATCGFPVAAKVIKLPESYGPYVRGSEWGEVDEADLARALLAAAAAKGGAVGAAATARIRATLSTEVVARAMEASLDRIVASYQSALRRV